MHTVTGQLFGNDGVVDEFAEDSEWPLAGKGTGLSDGVPDTETEAKMLGQDNFHDASRWGLTL